MIQYYKKREVVRMSSKVSSRLSLLSRIRDSLTIQATERIFKLMILPKSDYCDFIWNNLAPSNLRKLDCAVGLA